MRCSAAVAVTLGYMLLMGTAAAASDDANPTDPNARRDEVVVLVLAQDERFAGLPDHERQWIQSKAEFSFDPIIGSSYYRVLPTQNVWYAPLMDFGDGGSALVEIILVEGCEVPEDDSELLTPDLSRYEDPCAWRHSWLYRVEPDDTVTLLFEEGDPDSMPAE